MNLQKIQAERLLETYKKPITNEPSSIVKGEDNKALELEELRKSEEEERALGAEFLADMRELRYGKSLELLSKAMTNDIVKSGVPRAGLVAKKVQIKGKNGQMYYAMRWLKPEQAGATHQNGAPKPEHNRTAAHNDEHSSPINDVIHGEGSSRTKIKKLVEHGVLDHKELTKLSPNDSYWIKKHLAEKGHDHKEYEGHDFDDEGNFKENSNAGRRTIKSQSGRETAEVPVQRAQQAAAQALSGDLSDDEKEELSSEFDIDVDDMWDNYDFSMDMLIDEGSPKSMLVYGTGGVGKTFNLNKKLKAHNLRKKEDTTPDGEEINMASEDYDYLVMKGAMSIKEMWKKIVENKDKLIVFDDCDSMWKGGDDNPAKNILKGMLDSTGDGEVEYSSTVVKDDDGNPLPKKIKFTGKVIFISNLKREAFPQPLVDSRCNALDLTMTMEQTVSKLNSIKNVIEPTNERGEPLDGIEQEDRDRSMEFINKFQKRMGVGAVNGRTLAKLMVISKRCRLAGEDDAKFLKRAIHLQNLQKMPKEDADQAA